MDLSAGYSPPIGLEAPTEIVLTGTGSDESLSAFADGLTLAGLPTAQIVDWHSLLQTLMDPSEQRWARSGILCLFLLRFEDWDHFADHLRDKSITPSYELVRKKIAETSFCLEVAASRSPAQFCLCVLPWSKEAHECDYVRRFFETTAYNLEESLANVANVTVIRHWAKRYRTSDPPKSPQSENVSTRLEFTSRHD